MYNYIRCPTCNNSIGEKYELFVIMREHIHKKNIDKDMDLSIVSSNNDINIELNTIFEALKINNNCCRIRLNTICEFHVLLNENK